MRTVQIAGDFTPTNRGDILIGVNATRAADLRVRLELPALPAPLTPRDVSLVWVAAGLFGYEGLFRKKVIKGTEPTEVLVSRDADLDTNALAASVTEILRFTLGLNPEITVTPTQSESQPSAGPRSEIEFDTATLFSGGTDSLCGVLETKAHGWSPLGVSVRHSGGTTARVSKLRDSVLSGASIPVVGFGINTEGGWRLQQLRGVLYTVAAGVVASQTETRRIVISESGPTMVLPRIGPLDDVTLTTHPYLLRLTLDLLKAQYGKPFTLIEPYAHLTKAESLASCRAKDAVPSTHSCSNTRFASRGDMVNHCGVCFGCVIRRLSCKVAGIEDTSYAADPLTQSLSHLGTGFRKRQKVSEDKLAEIMDVLVFARRVMEGKLPPSVQQDLEAYGVTNLFARFAMDILSGLDLLGRRESIHNEWVSKFYQECVRDEVVTREMVDSRVADVRGGKFQPSFDSLLS